MTIRVLEPLDAPLFQQLRLFALQESPDAFGSTYENEVCRSMEQVAERIAPRQDGSCVFGAFLTDKEIVGIVGFLRDSGLKERHKGFIWGMYVRPECRRAGIGWELLERVIEHAKSLSGLRQIKLTVASSNAPAEHLYEKAGFTVYGVEKDSLASEEGFLDEKYMMLKL
jgi:ribosomal protein S18 acetylase RimI-like enzyme